jgi:phosphoribosylformylglycinamidine synthase
MDAFNLLKADHRKVEELFEQLESGRGQAKLRVFEQIKTELDLHAHIEDKKGREREVEEIFEKWDLHAAHVGFVTGDGLLRVKDHGAVVAEIPNTALVDEAPVYNRPVARPAYLDDVKRLDRPALSKVNAQDALFRILSSPTVGSKLWVYRQYDHMVRTNTIVLAGMGAGVIRVKGTSRALAMSVDGNGRYCYLDPHRGAMLAVAEAARNVACAGGQPIGATNCLNFGNPERPEIMWQFAESVKGIGEACRALDVPITGGNVSLYNETDGKAIYPTPVIGVVGVIDDAARALTRLFRRPDDAVVLLGETHAELGGSEFLKAVHGMVSGEPPRLDLDRERALIDLLVQASGDGLLRSAHDCSDGGVAVTLAECTFGEDAVGCDVDLGDAGGTDATLFSESASRAVVTTAKEDADRLLARAAERGVPARLIGRTGGSRLRVAIDGGIAIDCDVREAEARWNGALAGYFQRQAS